MLRIEEEPKPMDDPDWSQLPSDLISFIARKISIYSDYVRFRAVCCAWRSSLPSPATHLPSQFPWLMFSQPHHNPKSNHGNGWQSPRPGFYDPLTRKIHFLNLPEASLPRRVCSSSNGWLVVLEEGPDMFCLNPLTRAKVSLPPLSSFPNVIGFDFCKVGREYSIKDQYGNVCTRNLKQMRDTFLKKIVLSDSPGNGAEFIALAMVNYTGELAFCKRGDSSWKFIPDTGCFFEDVIYCNGLFFGVDSIGRLCAIDVGDQPEVRVMDTLSPLSGDLQYLVHSGDALLLVCRHLEVLDDEAAVDVYETGKIEVYKLDESKVKWEVVDSMEKHMIFLGKNVSMLLPASDFPGCKGNQVYFTDDHSEYNYDVAPPFYDMGIFNLDDERIDKLPYFVERSSSAFASPAPLWVSPNPN